MSAKHPFSSEKCSPNTTTSGKPLAHLKIRLSSSWLLRPIKCSTSKMNLEKKVTLKNKPSSILFILTKTIGLLAPGQTSIFTTTKTRPAKFPSITSIYLKNTEKNLKKLSLRVTWFPSLPFMVCSQPLLNNSWDAVWYTSSPMMDSTTSTPGATITSMAEHHQSSHSLFCSSWVLKWLPKWAWRRLLMTWLYPSFVLRSRTTSRWEMAWRKQLLKSKLVDLLFYIVLFFRSISLIWASEELSWYDIIQGFLLLSSYRNKACSNQCSVAFRSSVYSFSSSEPAIFPTLKFIDWEAV